MAAKLGSRQITQFLILGCGSNAIFYILFCRGSYYDAFMEAFSVTNTQFGLALGLLMESFFAMY